MLHIVTATSYAHTHTHKSSWVVWISTNFPIYFNQTLHNDLLDFAIRKSIFQSVAEKNYKRKGFPQFVGACAWSRRIHSTKFVQHPCLRRVQSFQVFLRSTSLQQIYYMSGKAYNEHTTNTNIRYHQYKTITKYTSAI